LKFYLFNLLVIVLIVGAVSIKVQVENKQYNETSRKRMPKENIYGTWVDTENNGVKITVDSLRKELVIDYSKSGGKVFRSNFQLNNKNQLTSDILPLGAELIIDENSQLVIYPLKPDDEKSIAIIYVLKFKKLK
jgi:hypothetical protein